MSNDEHMVYPKGETVLFTEGEYSDYGLNCVVVTLKECDLKELAQKFCEREYGEPDDFIAWLVANRHVAPMDYSECYLGDGDTGFDGFFERFGIDEDKAKDAGEKRLAEHNRIENEKREQKEAQQKSIEYARKLPYMQSILNACLQKDFCSFTVLRGHDPNIGEWVYSNEPGKPAYIRTVDGHALYSEEEANELQ